MDELPVGFDAKWYTDTSYIEAGFCSLLYCFVENRGEGANFIGKIFQIFYNCEKI